MLRKATFKVPHSGRPSPFLHPSLAGQVQEKAGHIPAEGMEFFVAVTAAVVVVVVLVVARVTKASRSSRLNSSHN